MSFIEQLTSISVQDWGTAAIIFVCMYGALYIFRSYSIHHLHELSKKTSNTLDDALVEIIKGIKWPFYVIVPLYVASLAVTLPSFIVASIWVVFLISIVFYAVRISQKVLIFLVSKSTDQEDQAIIQLLSSMIKLGLWIIAILLILSNLGYNVNSLLAGLGIGGLAIALALQNILSDIFSAISISLDKPFEVGDFIKIGNDSGTVQKIGIKSTRMKTLQGEELVISNKELTSARIQNFHKLQKRRVSYTLGVVYGTSTEKLKNIPHYIQTIYGNISDVEFSRAHLKELAASSINFEIVYSVTTDDYSQYMDKQQEAYYKILEKFESEGIEFAFPTQTIYLEK